MSRHTAAELRQFRDTSHCAACVHYSGCALWLSLLLTNEEFSTPGLEFMVPDISNPCVMFFPWTSASLRKAFSHPLELRIRVGQGDRPETQAASQAVGAKAPGLAGFFVRCLSARPAGTRDSLQDAEGAGGRLIGCPAAVKAAFSGLLRVQAAFWVPAVTAGAFSPCLRCVRSCALATLDARSVRLTICERNFQSASSVSGRLARFWGCLESKGRQPPSMQIQMGMPLDAKQCGSSGKIVVIEA